MQERQLNLKSILVVSVSVFVLIQAAAAMNSPPVVSSGEIPSLSQFGNYFHGVDANGVLNLQGPTRSIVSLSGYYHAMSSYLNIFYSQGENRGFTAATAGGGATSGGATGGGGDGGMM